jgi:hypothetical protein
MKIPLTHIQGCIANVEYTEDIVKGAICCACGNRDLILIFHGTTHLYDGKEIPCTLQTDEGFFFIVKAKCPDCGAEYLLFDKDFHGWDGCVCHDEKDASKPRPHLTAWKCRECNQEKHFIQIQFCYGDEGGIQEAIDDGTIDNPADAFEWIYIDIKCENCGLSTEKWVDYETA